MHYQFPIQCRLLHIASNGSVTYASTQPMNIRHREDGKQKKKSFLKRTTQTFYAQVVLTLFFLLSPSFPIRRSDFYRPQCCVLILSNEKMVFLISDHSVSLTWQWMCNRRHCWHLLTFEPNVIHDSFELENAPPLLVAIKTLLENQLGFFFGPLHLIHKRCFGESLSYFMTLLPRT